MPIDPRAEECVTQALREEIEAQEEVGRVVRAVRLPVRELWDQTYLWYRSSSTWGDLFRKTLNWRRNRLRRCCWAAWKLSWHRLQLRKWLAATTRRTAATE